MGVLIITHHERLLEFNPPQFTHVMLAGRIGGSVSAELGTMRVTEQLDAMRAMGADPIAYLVIPRVMACVVMMFGCTNEASMRPSLTNRAVNSSESA